MSIPLQWAHIPILYRCRHSSWPPAYIPPSVCHSLYTIGYTCRLLLLCSCIPLPFCGYGYRRDLFPQVYWDCERAFSLSVSRRSVKSGWRRGWGWVRARSIGVDGVCSRCGVQGVGDQTYARYRSGCRARHRMRGDLRGMAGDLRGDMRGGHLSTCGPGRLMECDIGRERPGSVHGACLRLQRASPAAGTTRSGHCVQRALRAAGPARAPRATRRAEKERDLCGASSSETSSRAAHLVAR